MAAMRLLRAIVIASALALLLHFFDSYFAWHLFSEAGGDVVQLLDYPIPGFPGN